MTDEYDRRFFNCFTMKHGYNLKCIKNFKPEEVEPITETNLNAEARLTYMILRDCAYESALQNNGEIKGVNFQIDQSEIRACIGASENKTKQILKELQDKRIINIAQSKECYIYSILMLYY